MAGGSEVVVYGAVRSLRPLLSLYLGPTDAFLALDVRFQQDLSAQQVEDAVGRLEKAIRAQHPEFKRILWKPSRLPPSSG